MSQDTLIKLKSKASKNVIWSVKNKKKNPDKLKLKKFDPVTRKHEMYVESKK
jgi:large subunit ribosomal protein L33